MKSKNLLPHLPDHIHHGSLRTRNPEDFEKSNIIITTYGTLAKRYTVTDENLV